MIIPVDYYQVLGLKRDADDSKIKSAYRKLALRYHPERNNTPGSHEKFISVAEAYSVLSSAQRKAIYDQFGDKGLKNGIPGRDGRIILIKDFQGFPGGYMFHGDADQVFNEFFGTKNPFTDFFVGQVEDSKIPSFGKKFGGLHGMANSTTNFQRIQDPAVEFDLELTLEELYYGALKKIKISKKIVGDDGQTTIPIDKILTIEVQRGWRHGTKIVFAKEGDQGMNKIPADIVFVVKEKPHDRFKRDGDNLLYEAGVSLVKALVGFALEVQTLDDRLLRIPINDTINPVYKKVVQGEGMPNSKTKKFGDLIIGFKTNFPQGLSPEQKKLLKQAFQ